MLLSIVVPVYNVEKYLEQCMKSILIDSYNYEIILVNDGSTDNSKKICEKFEKEFSVVKLVNKKNAGLSAARNTGFENAKGKYILFLDSDDYLVDGSVNQILKYIEDKNEDVLMSSYYEVCEDKIVDTVKFEIDETKNINDIKKQIFSDQGCIWTAWKFVVRKEFLEKKNIIFKKGYLHEDVDYTTRIILDMDSFRYMDFIWYNYRISREGSIMSKRNVKSTIHTAQIIIDLEKDIRASKYNEEFYSLVLARLSKVFFTTVRYSLNSNKDDLEKVSKMIHDNKFLLGSSVDGKHKMFYYTQRILGFKTVVKTYKKIKSR